MRRRFICYETSKMAPIANNEIWYTNGITTTATTPYSTTVFGANIVSNLYDAEKECWVITFDGPVTTIGMRAFRNCTSLTSVTIPDSVTSIGEWAFFGCTSLISVTIPDSVTTIKNYAFDLCSSLTSVTIPDSVTTIKNFAFYSCTSLTSVYCKATTPPALGGTSVFDDNGSGRKIYVPYQSVDAYKTATYWSEYADDIVGYNFENNNIIIFTLRGIAYQAERDMTWQEFVNSEYNVDGFFIDGSYVRTDSFHVIKDVSSYVTPSDVICNGCVYSREPYNEGGSN